MDDKIIKFEINPQNKELIDLQITSPDLQNINWKSKKIEVIIDLNHMSFRHVDGLNVTLFCWLKSRAESLSLSIKNVAENVESESANLSFLNSCISKIVSLKCIKYLKIVVQQVNIFADCDFSDLLLMPNLTVLDLSSFNIQKDADNKYLTPIIDLINSVDQKSNITKILLPLNIRNQELNIEHDYSANQLFIAIQYALSVSPKMIEISPMPIFFGLQYDFAAIMNKNQGAQLEEWYHEYDRKYATIQKLKAIPDPDIEITTFLTNIIDQCNNILKNIERFLPIIDSMNPKYICWLDKFLRNIMHNPDHILTCLQAVKPYDNYKDILFKMLQGLVSDLISSKFKESDIHAKELTFFICADGSVDQADIIKTLLKIHLEFDISKDDFLSKLFSNIIEEFVFGNGIKTLDHLISTREFEDHSWFLVKLLKKLSSSNFYMQQNDILKDEKYFRVIISQEQFEEQFDLFTSFSYKRLCAKYDLSLVKDQAIKEEAKNNLTLINLNIGINKQQDDTEQMCGARDTPRCSNGS